MKECNKCKVEKPLEMFSKNRTRPDGLQCYCKVCTKEYERSPKYKSSKAKYYRSDKGKAAKVNYRNSHPYKVKAHTIIRHAIKNGSLTRPNNCSKCLEYCMAPEAHHDDYNYPLKVRWLCRPCHESWHKVNKAIDHVDKV